MGEFFNDGRYNLANVHCFFLLCWAVVVTRRA